MKSIPRLGRIALFAMALGIPTLASAAPPAKYPSPTHSHLTKDARSLKSHQSKRPDRYGKLTGRSHAHGGA